MNDKQILKTISEFYGELVGRETNEFYVCYVAHCKTDGVEPREKNVVIREACKIMDCKTKQKFYSVFC